MSAQAALVERYQAAVYRYLLAAVRDLDMADELYQEFALRLGARRLWPCGPEARPVSRLYQICCHQSGHGLSTETEEPAPGGSGARRAQAPAIEGFDSDREFLAGWRKSLLDRVWESMAAAQEPDGIPFYTILRFRTDHPELSGGGLVEQLNARLRPTQPYADAGLRKILQRAREKFTDLLVEEVAHSMRAPSIDQLEQELIDLGFQAYYVAALCSGGGKAAGKCAGLSRNPSLAETSQASGCFRNCYPAIPLRRPDFTG